MANDRFPNWLFGPSEHQPYLVGGALSGGQPISGPPQTADMATGGTWAYEWPVARLAGHDAVRAYRAVLATMATGVGVMDIPVVDVLQPWPGAGRPARVPHSDKTPFDDGGLYAAEPIIAQLAANAFMPAWPAPPVPPTQAKILTLSGAQLRGGEYFTLLGASGWAYMHMIGRILNVVGPVTTVSFVPPLREDFPAGSPVDFNDPRFTGKLDLSSIKDAWPRYSATFISTPTLRFLETGAPP